MRSGLYKSTSGGATWTKIDSTLEVGWGLALTAGSIYQAGGSYDQTVGRTTMAVSKSTDGGGTWLTCHLGNECGEVKAIAVSPLDSNLVLAGGWLGLNGYSPLCSRVFRSTDGGTHWTKVDTGAFGTAESSIKGIAFDPDTQSWVLAASGVRFAGEAADELVGVYTSTDAGLTWSSPTQRIDATCITADPTTPGRFFLGSGEGVWVSCDHGVSWRQINDGLPTLSILSLAYDPVNRFLYAGTDGRGVVRLDVGTALSVEPQQEAPVPTSFALSQNFPNPFNPSTTIKYELPRASNVTLTVYDMLGREVSVLVNERREAGFHEVKFDGAGLSSGVYFYRIRAGHYIASRKMLVLR